MKAVLSGCFAALITLAIPAGPAQACKEHAKNAAHVCDHPKTGAASAGDASAKGGKLVIPVNGMHCSQCAERVTAAVAKVKGVKFVETDLDTGRATVVVEGAVPSSAVVAAIEGAGYEPGQPATN